MPGQNQYSVYDIKACKYILRDKSNNVIEKTIGMPKERASRYAKHAILYKDRYRIISKQEIISIHAPLRGATPRMEK